MAEAMNLALDILLQRLEIYDSVALDFDKATVFLISDGHPTSSQSEMKRAARRIREMEEIGKLAVFPIATQHGAMNGFRTLCVRQPVKLRDANYREMFRWMSLLAIEASRSRPRRGYRDFRSDSSRRLGHPVVLQLPRTGQNQFGIADALEIPSHENLL